MKRPARFRRFAGLSILLLAGTFAQAAPAGVTIKDFTSIASAIEEYAPVDSYTEGKLASFEVLPGTNGEIQAKTRVVGANVIFAGSPGGEAALSPKTVTCRVFHLTRMGTSFRVQSVDAWVCQ